MKKHVLITSVHAGIGGIETVLIEFLKYLDSLNYGIDLILLKKEGFNLQKIPNSVKVMTPEEISGFLILEKVLKKGSVISKIIRRIIFNKYSVSKYIPKKEYDISIAFSGYQTFVDLIAAKSNAKKKYIWCHTNVKWQFENDKKFQKQFNKSKFKYNLFDKIIFVSESCKDLFLDLFPVYKDKSDYVWNLIPQIEKNNKTSKKFKAAYNVISVGRLEIQKAFHRIIEINEILIKKGININFYIIGSGHLEKKLIRLINDSNYENIYLLGSKNNVSEYMKNADLFLMTSYCEGLPTVLLESLSYHLPFVAPKVSGVIDIVKYIAPEGSCIMTDNSVEELANGIIKAMNKGVNKNFDFSQREMTKMTKNKLNELL